MSVRSTVNWIVPSRGRRTVSATRVPFSPLISSSERSNGSRRMRRPSIDTMRSPGLMPAARAGPSSAAFTISPSRRWPTVSPMPP